MVLLWAAVRGCDSLVLGACAGRDALDEGVRAGLAAGHVVLAAHSSKMGVWVWGVLQDCITFLQDPRVTSSLEDHRVKYLQVSSLRWNCYGAMWCSRAWQVCA